MADGLRSATTITDLGNGRVPRFPRRPASTCLGRGAGVGAVGVLRRPGLCRRAPDGSTTGAHATHDEMALASPMPATVAAVRVTPGQAVARGDVLIMLEAMKMELPIIAPRVTARAVRLVSRRVQARRAMLRFSQPDEDAPLRATSNDVNDNRLPRRVRIVEVGPRDGLQNEAAFVPTADKIAFVNRLAEAGHTTIEVSAFVSPKWVPQMADASEVCAGITRRPGVRYTALVPNLQGLARAREARVDEVAVFPAASETFSRRNINQTIDEALAQAKQVCDEARPMQLPRSRVSLDELRLPVRGGGAAAARRRTDRPADRSAAPTRCRSATPSASRTLPGRRRAGSRHAARSRVEARAAFS